MSITTAIARAASNTANGNQDITDASFGGGTPKACIVIWNECITAGTAIDGARFSYGFATGAANQGCTSGNAQHNDAVSGDYRGQSEFDRVINGNAFGGSGAYCDGAFVSFITNGIRINWVQAPTIASLMTVILLGGDDLQAHADNYVMGVDTTVNDITAPGFQPQLIFSLGQNNNGAGTQRISRGVIWDEPSVGIKQHALSQFSLNGGNPTDISSTVYQSLGTAFKFRTSASIDISLAYSDFDANGFTTTTVGPGGTTNNLYLALDFGANNEILFDTYVTPASTGDDKQTVGFKPQLAMLLFLEEITAFDTQFRSGTRGWAVFNETSEFCESSSDEDGVDATIGGTNTQSLSSARALEVPDGAGTLDIEADFVSFDSTGYTLNYTNIPVAQRAYLQVVIEADDPQVPGAAVLTGIGDLVAVGADRLPGAASLTGIGDIVAFGNTVPQAELTGIGLLKARGVDANAEGGAGIILRHRGGLGEMSGIVQRREFIELTSAASEVVSAPFHLGGNSWEVKFKTAAALNGIEGSYDLEDWDVMTDLFNAPITDRDAGTIVGLERPKWLRTVVSIDASQPREFSSIISVQKQQGS